MSRYDDIIALERPVSKRHKPMSMVNRAAQFSSFAALTGYEDVIRETGRETDGFRELDEYEKYRISDMINIIIDEPDTKFKLTYFTKDRLKDGGSYMTVETKLRKYLPEKSSIMIENGDVIDIGSISDIEI